MPATNTVRPKPTMALQPVLPSSTPSSALPSPDMHGFTTKEWILPPRPKPGRKPATDVPPTKRKAQNRAAQRAFRERRAQRVGELEDKIRVIEKDKDETEIDLRNEIQDLKAEVEKWKLKYEIEAKKNGNNVQDAPDIPTPPSTATEEHMGCDKCTPSHCQCLSEILNFPAAAEYPKRPLSPPGSTSPVSSSERGSKRHRTDHSELETDFTSLFSKPKATLSSSCGLCAPGTSCLCASVEPDIAREAGLSPPTSVQNEGGCSSGGPGTCDRCQRDPQARLFCTSLASISKNEPGCSKPSGCCGGTACRGNNSSQTTTAKAKSTMSCSETYTTLSEHPKFADAMKTAKERETWLPRLHPAKNPPPANQNNGEKPGALEIEVASVMGVLKHFERRFGNEK